MANPTDQELATAAAARANEAANVPRDPRAVRSSVKAAAAAARAAIPAGAGALNEPTIASAGTGIVPQPGAARHEGERAAPTAPGEIPITIVDDEEYDALERQQQEGGAAPPREAEAEPVAPGTEAPPTTEEPVAGEEAAPAEGEAPVERPVVQLPPRNPGQAPIEVEVDDPELAEHLRRLARASLRRDEFHRAMTDVEQREEELAQFEDALRLDPVNLVVERVNPETKVDLALALMSDPSIFNRVMETFGGLEGEQLQLAALKLDKERLDRGSGTLAELAHRAHIRQQGREIRTAIQRIVPEDMDERTASLLYRDLERDVTQHIMDNKLRRLPVEELPRILEARLALYGMTADQAAARLQDTGIPPMPVRARPAGASPPPARGANGQPARTPERVVQQAEARRRAGAVPGGGAGAPAQSGWALPKKQGVKARIAALREMVGLG